MSVKDSQVFAIAMQFCKGYSRITPEVVFLAYAKLLSVNSSVVNSLIPDERISELDEVHTWFAEHDLDPALIKSVYGIASNHIYYDDNRDIILEQFDAFINQEDSLSSIEILNKAFEMTSSSYKSMFKIGNSKESIISLIATMERQGSKEIKKGDSLATLYCKNTDIDVNQKDIFTIK